MISHRVDIKQPLSGRREELSEMERDGRGILPDDYAWGLYSSLAKNRKTAALRNEADAKFASASFHGDANLLGCYNVAFQHRTR